MSSRRFNKLFPEHAPDEKLIFFTRKHWFLFFIIFAILFLMFIIPFTFLAISIRSYPAFFVGSVVNLTIIISSMYLLFLMAAFLLSFINLYFDIMIVTNKRIIDINQKGLFNREINELDLLHVEDVSAKVAGILGTVFDFGSVEIQTAGTARNFLFSGVPHPRQICQTIQNQYKAILEHPETIEHIRKIDKAEGLGRRILGLKSEPEISKPTEFNPTSSQEGELEEGKSIDFSDLDKDKK